MQLKLVQIVLGNIIMLRNENGGIGGQHKAWGFDTSLHLNAEEKCLKPAYGDVKVWSWEADSGIRPCPVLLGKQTVFAFIDARC